MATIKDIAKASGYSIGTVSRVLNNRTDVSEQARQAVEEAIRKYNYQPNTNARMLKQTISSEVSVILRGNRSTFLAYILEEIQIRMREHGESINVQFIGETDDEVATAIQIGQNIKPKGIIFVGGNSYNFRKGFSQIPVPCVLVTVDGEKLGFDNLSSFTVDDEEAAGFAVSKLLEQGHRRIGILGGGYSKDDEEHKTDYNTLRIRGVVNELKKHGIAFDFEKDYELCTLSPESGYAAAEKLLKRSPDLTAVFAITDAVAMGAMRAFKDMGLRVPEDISVIGFNGINYVKFSNPRLATIRQDITTLVRKSVDDLLLRISYASPAVHEKIPYEFIDGESIAPPRR